ncbi:MULTISPECIES: hypothetical protein [Delftia]|uniref:Peptide chain release factor 2 n=2 Tax=Delftia TaxID=80865 RepID=A0A7T2S9V2_DELAC|nr:MULTISPECIES: hypothetical protein [Delftia]MBL8357230.1 hypothetical protein [Delftia acidovorans]QPS11610.1 hypothetical protein I6G66_07160 [Delftia acidovorans]
MAAPLQTRAAGACPGTGPQHEKIGDSAKNTFIRRTEHIMEAERINLIGNTLEDLSQRAADLRRYL